MKKTTVIIILSLLTLVLCALNAGTQKYSNISHKHYENPNYEEKLVRLESMLAEIQDNVQELKKMKTQKPTVKEVKGTVGKIACNLKNMMIFLVDKSDKIFSKKFLALMILITSPIILTYDRLIDSTFIERNLEKIISLVADIVTKIVLLVKLKVREKEIDNSFWMVFYQPWASIKIWTCTLGEKIIDGGIVAGILMGTKTLVEAILF